MSKRMTNIMWLILLFIYTIIVIFCQINVSDEIALHLDYGNSCPEGCSAAIYWDNDGSGYNGDNCVYSPIENGIAELHIPFDKISDNAVVRFDPVNQNSNVEISKVYINNHLVKMKKVKDFLIENVEIEIEAGTKEGVKLHALGDDPQIILGNGIVGVMKQKANLAIKQRIFLFFIGFAMILGCWLLSKDKKAVDSSKLEWIYQLRALAILAVVVCHQQHILHTSEWVQFMTLFSVTTLIFLAGSTQFLSAKKSKFVYSAGMNNLIKKLSPVLCSYLIATIVYLIYYNLWDGMDFNTLLYYLLNFSASAPFYFVKYYCVLTLLSPILILLVNRIYVLGKWKRNILWCVLTYLTFYIGYLLIDKASFLGGSYLCVYTIGIIFARLDFSFGRATNKIQLWLGLVILVIGFYFTKQFYFNYANEIYTPTIIDKAVSKLSMNPPNLSIILYSLGVILTFSYVFQALTNLFKGKWGQKPLKILTVIGKYSLDIFLWHWIIRDIIVKNACIGNIWIKRIVVYSGMICIPIIIRKCLEYIRSESYEASGEHHSS